MPASFTRCTVLAAPGTVQFPVKCLGAVALEPLDPILGELSSEALLCSLHGLAEQQALVFAPGLRERRRQTFGRQCSCEHIV